MILLVGALFWALATLLLWQLVCRPGSNCLLAHRWSLALAAGLLLLAVVAYFRPEEIIFSGEDPGAYLNTAAELKRQGSLSYSDALFGELSEADKLAFSYGHTGFGKTKDAVLWVKDSHSAVMGSWFQPVYPLMMAAAARLLPDYVIFLVVPLFAVLNAVLLAFIAHYLTGRRLAGLLAFLFYLLNPVVIWNGRCPRPEVIASFLVLAGLFLLIRLISEKTPFGFSRALLAGLALGLAPLVHITALYVLAPAVVAFLCLARRNVAEWMGWWTGVISGLVLLLLEIRYITDCYFLWRFLNPAGHVLRLALSCGALLAGALAVAWGAARIRGRVATAVWGWRRTAGIVASVLVVGVCVCVYCFRTQHGKLPFLPAGTAAYLSLTDFRNIVMLMSWPLALAAVAGIVAWLCRCDDRWLARVIFLVVLLPSVLTIGWMTNFMFETRRAVLTIAPMITLCVAGGLALLAGATHPIRRGLALLAAACLLIWPVHGRSFLYTTWSLKGTYAFCRDLADVVKRENGILFGEYTQYAAPFEHLFGIPLLSVDTDHRSDDEIEAAEKAMAKVMRHHPDRSFFLLTPFCQPVIPGITLEPLLSRTHRCRTLGRETSRLPAGARTMTVELHLLRARLCSPGESPSLPFTRIMDQGRLGSAGLANVRSATVTSWNGVKCPAFKPIAVPWDMIVGNAAAETYLFFAGAGAAQPAGRITLGGHETTAQWYPLDDGWCVARIIMPPDSQLSSVKVETANDLVLVQANLLQENGSRIVPLASDSRGDGKTEVPVQSRWLRQYSDLDLPDGQLHGLRLLVLSMASREPGQTVEVTVTRSGDGSAATFTALPRWSWNVLAFPSRENAPAQDRFLLACATAWDPKVRGFPPDLGFRLSRVTVITAPR